MTGAIVGDVTGTFLGALTGAFTGALICCGAFDGAATGSFATGTGTFTGANTGVLIGVIAGGSTGAPLHVFPSAFVALTTKSFTKHWFVQICPSTLNVLVPHVLRYGTGFMYFPLLDEPYM